MPGELYDIEWCRRRRLPTSSLVKLLREREMATRREGTHFVKGERELYHCFPLMFTHYSGNRPPFHPMRFTPDGHKLIGFGPHLQDVHIYSYAGVQVVGKFRRQKATAASNDDLFDMIFPSCQRVPLPSISQSEPCCLITPDSRHLIVSTSMTIPEGRAILTNGIKRNSESLAPSSLYDVTFYCVDLKKGELQDSIKFDFDLINPIHGVCLVGRTLAILSVQHQTIHLYEVDGESGQLRPLLQVGRFRMDDDSLYAGTLSGATTEMWMTGFRQHFLTFLYKQHVREGEADIFLRNISFYRELKMHKIQPVGPHLLLIRMDCNVHRFDLVPIHYMFVLFEWKEGRILGVYQRNSKELFALFERFNESFRNGHLLDNPFPTSIEHSDRARHTHQNMKASILATTHLADLHRRLLGALPYANSITPTLSPYLDPQIFNVDERLLAAIERGRIESDKPLRIFSHRTGRVHTHLRFQRPPQQPLPQPPPHEKSIMRLIFHPSDPLAMAVNRSMLDAHLYVYTHGVSQELENSTTM